MAQAEAEAVVGSSADVARSYFDAVAARDVDAMLGHWDAEGTGYIHGMVDEVRIPETYRGWFADFFRSFPDLSFEVIELIAEGERAAVSWRATGTFTGPTPFEGLIPNGARVKAEGCDLLTIRDGRIVSIYAYTNALENARQLGAMPPRGSLADRAMLGAANLKTRVGRLTRRS
ncbi:MAG TPA: nuclear transport factor 2 family protein [Solirubrobacterales bacterium]|nr:nuclear transport factor 2 family protein [Solirubrobacterales bacterium]